MKQITLLMLLLIVPASLAQQAAPAATGTSAEVTSAQTASPDRLADLEYDQLQGFTEEYATETDADYYFECTVSGSFSTSAVSWPAGVEQAWAGSTPILIIAEAGGENVLHCYYASGSYMSGDPFNPIPVSNAYGVAGASQLYINNESGNDSGADMYRSNWNSSWSATNNPAGNTGRGMSFDANVTQRIFEAKDPKTIVHFSPGSSSGYSFNASSHVGGSWITGIAACDASDAFPELGMNGTAVVVCARGSDDLWLFVRSTGGSWEPIGSVDMPGVASNYNQGITYHEGTGKFYLTHNSGSSRVYVLDLSAGVIPDNPPTITRVNPTSSSVSITAGESINFQVSASDPDGDLDRFEWYLDGTKVAEHSASGGSDTDNWNKIFSSAGTFSVQARVYDEQNNMANLSWSISVAEPSYPPEIFRDNPSGENVNVIMGESINFQVHATDQNGDLAYFQWTLDGMPMAEHPVSGSSANDSWENSFTQPGTFEVVSAIFDNESNSDELSWTVTVTNPSPEIFPDYPSESNVDVYPGQSIEFQVHATDANSDLDHFSWYLDGTLQEEMSASGGYSEASWDHTFESTGLKEVECRIYDSGDNNDYTVWQVSINVCNITVTDPDASTTWTHFETDLPINWEYPVLLGTVRSFQPLSGETVTIQLYDGTTLVETLAESIDNDGNWVMSDPVPMEWNPGTGYRVKVTDNLGNYGWSEDFTMEPSENQEIITVIEPDASTTWTHFETDMSVNWQYPALLGSLRRFQPLSGETVTIQLYDGTTLVETLAESIDNDGNWVMSDPVPMEWDPGTGYRVKVTDNLDNYGWSEDFTIIPCEGDSIIIINEPNSETEWHQTEQGVAFDWEYPTLRGLGGEIRPLSGENVSIYLCYYSTPVDTLAENIGNTGSWIMDEPVSENWSPDSCYRILISDDFNNFGWSDSFTILPPVDVEDSQEEVDVFELFPATPNPSTGHLTLSFSVGAECRVQMALYDICGREILTATNDDYRTGSHAIVVRDLKPGIYFCRMNAEGFTATQRLVVIN